MTTGQFGGNLAHTLGCSGVSIFQDQGPPPPDGVAHILVIDDIAEIMEPNAEIFLAGTPNREAYFNVLP